MLKKKNAHQVPHIQEWFNQFRRAVEDKGIVATDLYNFDETGFRIRVGKNQWVITREAKKKSFLASSNNRELVTCVKSISADGCVLPQMIILSAAQHLEPWVQNGLEDDVLFAVTESGYTNDAISLQWIEHFVKYSAQQQLGAWRMLVFDGCGSHCTYEFLEICERNKIVPFCLPPHTSHILQLLDVVVFQPYKHYHALAVNHATRTGCRDFNKVEFLNSITSIRRDTFKTTTIQSAFRKTGLHPIDPKLVLDTLQEYQTTPPPLSSSTSYNDDIVPTTPLTIRTLSRQAETIKS